MKTFVALCFIALISVAVADDFNCLYLQSENDAVYSVCKFNDVTTFSDLNVSSKRANLTVQVSLAANVPNCDQNASNVYATLTDYTNPENVTCTVIAAADPATVSSINTEDPTKGLVLSFSELNTYSVVVDLNCDENQADKSQFDTVNIDGKTVTVSVASNNSCPNSTLSKLAYFMDKYPAVFVTIFILIGTFICFAGLSMLKYTIFITGAVLGTLLSAYLFLGLVHYSASVWVSWVVFVICLIIGGVIGWIAVKIETAGFIILGTALGVVGGNLLYTAIGVHLSQSLVLYWVMLVVCGAIGAALAYKFWKSFVIIATGILGAFMIVKAIGSLAGGFPSADTLGEGFKFTKLVYAYIAGIVVLSVAGIYVQHKRKKAAEIEEEEKDVHGYQRVMAGYDA